MSQLDEVDRKYTAKRLYWAIEFWWKEGVNSCQSGGHFGYEEGDLALDVVQKIALVRRVDLAKCYRISIELRTTEGW